MISMWFNSIEWWWKQDWETLNILRLKIQIYINFYLKLSQNCQLFKNSEKRFNNSLSIFKNLCKSEKFKLIIKLSFELTFWT